MNRQDITDLCIVVWVVLIFLCYHYQYLALARTFVEFYASRYTPGLAPIISGMIP